MSDFEMLLTAWLNGGEIPADFKPTSRVEEYLLAILEGVDDDVTPESRADVLLDAIATKYAGYADGITDLREKLGLDTRPEFDEATTPQLIALAQDLINGFALGDLAEKGATGVARNTLAILDAYSTLPSGGGVIQMTVGYFDQFSARTNIGASVIMEV